MNLLTDKELKDAVRKLFVTPEAHEMAMVTSLDEYRLIVSAVIAKLAAGVNVEPYDYSATDKAWAHTETTLRTAVAAARVQAIDACVDALVAEDGLKVISVEEAVEAIRSVLGGTP